MMQKRNQSRRSYDDYEDDYDVTDGFVVDDELELDEEARRELDKITNKKKILKLARKNDSNHIAVSSIYQIKEEERYSDKMARQEDEMQKEILRKEKIAQKKKRGFMVESDDEIDVDESDEDEDEEDEEEEELNGVSDEDL